MSITIEHISPAEPLDQYVGRFWHITTDQPATLRVIPDGCWDIVINAHESPEFVGPMTQAFMVPLKPGDHHYGVRFKAGTYFVPLQTDMVHRVDSSIKLVELIDFPIERNNPAATLEKIVAACAAQGLLTRDRIVEAVIKKLGASEEQSFLTLYKELGISASTVERKFKKYVGFSPQTLGRILRQLAVNKELMVQEFPHLGRLAADFGYVDQAHMTHDLRLLSGSTPGSLRREYDDYIQDDRA